MVGDEKRHRKKGKQKETKNTGSKQVHRERKQQKETQE